MKTASNHIICTLYSLLESISQKSVQLPATEESVNSVPYEDCLDMISAVYNSLLKLNMDDNGKLVLSNAPPLPSLRGGLSPVMNRHRGFGSQLVSIAATSTLDSFYTSASDYIPTLHNLIQRVTLAYEPVDGLAHRCVAVLALLSCRPIFSKNLSEKLKCHEIVLWLAATGTTTPPSDSHLLLLSILLRCISQPLSSSTTSNDALVKEAIDSGLMNVIINIAQSNDAGANKQTRAMRILEVAVENREHGAAIKSKILDLIPSFAASSMKENISADVDIIKFLPPMGAMTSSKRK